ncbi:MAG: hypothetical protein ACO1O1_05445 [Adhaeribacter sp.]
MLSPPSEDPATKATPLFFPLMSTLLFIGLAIYELPARWGWVYLAVALFGVVTVYLSWQGNKRKARIRAGEDEKQENSPGQPKP